jgi:hypothetical protein
MIEGGDINSDEFKALSKTIADCTEDIVESNEGRDNMIDLIDRTTEALYNQG